MVEMKVARSELILGGQKSGKSRRAESMAAAWLAQSPSHRAVFIATAQAQDEEMHERIARHRRDRAERLPGMTTEEEPLRLAEAIARHSRADTLLVVDCLTLWLTNWLMPAPGASPHPSPLPKAEGAKAGEGLFTPSSWERAEVRASAGQTSNQLPAPDMTAQAAMLSGAIRSASGPVVLVSNEIGLGVTPLGREVRAFVDALGQLNQDMGRVCERVTLMAAGLPLILKGEA